MSFWLLIRLFWTVTQNINILFSYRLLPKRGADSLFMRIQILSFSTVPLASNFPFSTFSLLLFLSNLILRVQVRELPLLCRNTVGLRMCLCVCKGIIYNQLV